MTVKRDCLEPRCSDKIQWILITISAALFVTFVLKEAYLARVLTTPIATRCTFYVFSTTWVHGVALDGHLLHAGLCHDRVRVDACLSWIHADPHQSRFWSRGPRSVGSIFAVPKFLPVRFSRNLDTDGPAPVT